MTYLRFCHTYVLYKYRCTDDLLAKRVHERAYDWCPDILLLKYPRVQKYDTEDIRCNLKCYRLHNTANMITLPLCSKRLKTNEPVIHVYFAFSSKTRYQPQMSSLFCWLGSLQIRISVAHSHVRGSEAVANDNSNHVFWYK